ncbi:MAG: peptidyl-prolyl cis-trans isomerase [Phycisphaerales bacterium]|nr:peptidyl-prolyl cis-trans isomerase [Phycisphaerales bacterium]
MIYLGCVAALTWSVVVWSGYAEGTKPSETVGTTQPACSSTECKRAPGHPTTASAPATQPATRPADAKPRVELDTSMGRIVLELEPDKAPITVKNFLHYVEASFYDETIFHRVISTFMIQGGGFNAARRDGQKTVGLLEPIKNEANNGLKNLPGTIAMARTSAPHSATAQFFINVADNANLDYPSFDGWGYCVFGRVIEGMDVVERIKNIETKASFMNPREKSQPVEPPVIKKARRLD